MFSKYMYLIVGLVFPTSGFWSRNFFLVVHFPDHCLSVPLYETQIPFLCCVLLLVIFDMIFMF